MRTRWRGEALDRLSSAFYARLAGALFGLTYFGWAWVALLVAGKLLYGDDVWSTTEWWAIEGETYTYWCSIAIPAILVGVLSIGVVVMQRAWMVRLAAVLSVSQVSLLVWLTWWELGVVEHLFMVSILSGLALGVVVAWTGFRRGTLVDVHA